MEGDILYRYTAYAETDDAVKCQPVFYVITRATKATVVLQRIMAVKGEAGWVVKSPFVHVGEEERIRIKRLVASFESKMFLRWRKWKGRGEKSVARSKWVCVDL